MSQRISVPRIIFEVSLPYYERERAVWLDKNPEGQYPSYEEVESGCERMKELWLSKKEGVLEQLVRISGLRWQTREIPCYIIGRYPPLGFSMWSKPLTIPFEAYLEGPDFFFIDLVHELLHIFLGNNANLFGKDWIRKYLLGRYGSEPDLTRRHILIHALHACLWQNLGLGGIDVISHSKHPDYIRSMEIIRKEGYQKIVNEFVGYIQNRRRNI